MASGVAAANVIPIIAITMLTMTGAVAVDCHKRNKYAAPWFILVAFSGIFGVLFYYITIRTEDQSELPSPPPIKTRLAIPILAIIGAFCAFGGILGVIATSYSGSSVIIFIYGIPALAIGLVLYYDFSHDTLAKQKLFSECLYALAIGGVLSVGLFPREFASRFISYHTGTGITIAVTILFPIGWYVVRKKRANQLSFQSL